MSGTTKRASVMPPRRSQPPPASGEEELDLTAEQRRKIETVFDQLTQIGLYELIGVPPTADTKTIKRTYNARVMEFHPDRFFRKRLGPYKAKLEAIMRRMTEAQDILCSAEHRARYDHAIRTHRSTIVDAMIAEAVEELGDADGSDQRISVVPAAVRIPSMPPPIGPRSGTRPAEPEARRPSRPPPASRRLPAADVKPSAPPMPREPAPFSDRPPAPSAMPPEPPPLAPPRRPPAVRSSGPIENGIAKLRELHERHKRRPLEGAERLLYDRVRDEVTRIIVASQRLSLRDGETPRRALRVVCALKVTLSLASAVHRTVALDLSVGGLAAVIDVEPEPDTRCDFAIDVEPVPIRGRARVVGATPHGRDTFRVSIAFERLDATTSAQLDALVLDLALGKLQL